MADNFGSKQNRVVAVKDRNIDNVVFLTCRPPLTSEWNLINQIGNEKILDATRLSLPSGWLRVGHIGGSSGESNAKSGDVITSDLYSNSFKLVSKGGNIAVVNGWRILVQGWNSSDDNNVIELNAAGGQRYDFVFLEVWRKLVAYNESLYPYGNVSKTPYTDNEILWPAVGTETSMRVQVQYRIRSVPISIALTGASDVFKDVPIHPIGGRVTGEYAYLDFAAVDPDDVGLYKAGNGSPEHQAALATVDGYVYAIPMFLVYRRSPSDSVFSVTTINSGYTTLMRENEGYVRDRPDAMLCDTVGAEDIIDFRHQVLSDADDVRDVLERTVSKLVAGDLTTALKMGYDANGQESTAVSGGSVLMKAERINSTGFDNIPNMGTGDSFRRAFCNAGITLKHNVVKVGEGPWSAGTIAISSFFSKDYGRIASVDGLYALDTSTSPSTGVLVTNVSYDADSITISSGSNLIGTSYHLYMEFTFSYDASDAGFKDVPRTLLEASKGSFTPISLGNPVNVRFNNDGDLLYFGLTPNCGDTTKDDYVVCRGGNYTENYHFGHDLVAYRTTTNPGATVTFSLSNGKLNGYYILGVKRVRVKSDGSYGNPVAFTQERSVTVGPPYVIDGYIVTVTGYPGADVEVTLITGSKPPNDVGEAYDIDGSMKFYEMNKQGRGIIDTYEMIDVVAKESSPGKYTIDTSSFGKPIIAIGTKTHMSGSFESGDPIAFRHDNGEFVSITTSNPNMLLPVLSEGEYASDWLPTSVVVESSIGLGKIRVPVLVHSFPTADEAPYTFFYKMVPYQGILSSVTEYSGKILCEGPSFVTTLGSGAIDEFGYNHETVKILNGQRVVSGNTGVDWSGKVQAGDYIAIGVTGMFEESEGYRIDSVTGPSGLVLSELYAGAGHTGAPYVIYRKDTPSSGISNVVDRLPSYYVHDSTRMFATDSSCMSDKISIASANGAFLECKPVLRSQDPLVSIANDFIVGSKIKTNSRGRYDFVLSSFEAPVYRLCPANPRAHIVYQSLDASQTLGRRKTYQTYLFARSSTGLITGFDDMTGRIYLLIISGETCSGIENLLTTFSSVDTVDIFELVGRPVIKAP